MSTLFSSDFFRSNREQLRAQISSDTVIVITANGQMQRAADEPCKFVQDSNFWYLTGINIADLVLVISASATYLITPLLSSERETFDGAIDLKELVQRSGIIDMESEREGWKRLQADLKKHNKAAILSPNPQFMKRYRMHTLPYRRRLNDKLRRICPMVQLQDVRPLLALARTIKQPAELQAIQKAITITGETLQSLASSKELPKISYEYQLEAAITYGFRNRGAEGHAFSPITAAGVHTTTLHHVDNGGAVTYGDMIVLDVGASVEHYAADITRTISQAPFSPRQKAVFDSVIEIQDYALGLLKPGVSLRDYERSVAMETGKQLVKLHLIKRSTDITAIRKYFPHATSHFLGLDTHDVGDYSRTLDENMVLTCEPGIYIPEERLGVRIEDDVVITKGGNQVLSQACPRALSLVQ